MMFMYHFFNQQFSRFLFASSCLFLYLNNAFVMSLLLNPAVHNLKALYMYRKSFLSPGLNFSSFDALGFVSKSTFWYKKSLFLCNRITYTGRGYAVKVSNVVANGNNVYTRKFMQLFLCTKLLPHCTVLLWAEDWCLRVWDQLLCLVISSASSIIKQRVHLTTFLSWMPVAYTLIHTNACTCLIPTASVITCKLMDMKLLRRTIWKHL